MFFNALGGPRHRRPRGYLLPEGASAHLARHQVRAVETNAGGIPRNLGDAAVDVVAIPVQLNIFLRRDRAAGGQPVFRWSARENHCITARVSGRSLNIDHTSPATSAGLPYFASIPGK